MLATKQLMGQTDFHRIFFHTMKVNGVHQLFNCRHSSKSSFCVQQKKKIHTGLEQLNGKLKVNDDGIFIFGCTIPLMNKLFISSCALSCLSLHS